MRSLFLLVGLGCLLASPTDLTAQYAVYGLVRDSATGAPLADVVVTVQREGRTDSAGTTPSGRFQIADLPAGPVDVRVRGIGYHPRDILGLSLPLGGPLEVMLARPDAVPLGELVAAAARGGDVTAPLDHVITRDEITTLTYLGEDAYRALARAPGVTADELSARFRLRGAEQEEVLLRVDGLTLVDPFHLNDLSGALSIVDGHWVERATVSSAGFGAQYGDRTGGVVELVTREPSAAGHRLFLSASPTHLRAATEGGWGDGRGGWLVSVRRGVPELVLASLRRGSDFSAGYLDGMAKLTWTPASNHTLSWQLLGGADHFDAHLAHGQTLSQSRSWRGYGWLRWQAAWSSALRTETVLALTGISPRRKVDFYPSYPDGVAELRALRQLSARHEIEWAVGDGVAVRAGAEIRHAWSHLEYAFRARVALFAPPQAEAAAEAAHVDAEMTRIVRAGTAAAAYVAPRVRLWNRLDVETGIRYDHASYARGPRLDPRVRGRLELTENVALFGGWGRYSQAKGLHELDLVAGERAWPIQRAVQTTTGLEWRPDRGLRVRAEGFRRIVTQPWVRHLNVEPSFEIIPETDNDYPRVAPARSRMEGLELELDGRLGPKIRWRAGYSLSRVEDLLEGKWVPRTYDQRHAATVDGVWRVGRRWSLSLAWQGHSGWPIAEPDFTRPTVQGGHVLPSYDYLQLGEARLPAYHRIDLRIRHDHRLAGGTLGVSLDLVNVLNRRNVGGISYTGVVEADGTVTPRRELLTMAPLAPVLMVSWAR